ncbi:putative DNA binding domain-containing protein [Desulfobacterales bacterium HSG17]|nr:putative DNA binding domain-containing protein [Desulfobacterales bacterium HSG17]
MNFAKLERMVIEGDMSKDALIYLLHCRTECEWLDYKESLILSSDSSACNFSRDVVALKNVGGGYLVIGVKDKSWIPIGIQNFLPYDSKELQDKIIKCTGLTIDVYIVHHEIMLKRGKTKFALIYVRSSKKRSKRYTPSLTKRSFLPKESYGIRQGEIYIRENDSTIRAKSLDSVRELVERLADRSDEDSFKSDSSSPFAVINNTYRLLEKGYDTFIGRNELREKVFEAITKDPRIWIINVHGPGGVGKSALVNWATYEFFENKTFEAIIQLTAKETYLSPTGIKKLLGRSLYSLENLLDHIFRVFEEVPPDTIKKKIELAEEILSAWKTLIVLDNMETVSDGRIIEFIQRLPPETKTKVVITSRERTGGWELPVSVEELNISEIKEFINIKKHELDVNFPFDDDIISRVKSVTGGLPLAIQWLIGRYKLSGNIEEELKYIMENDSPVLEFSFRNIWNRISKDARAVLAIMSIYDTRPPTVDLLSVTLGWQIDRIERALSELINVTLVTKSIQEPEGNIVYTALPITLSFAQHQLCEMGDFEEKCRQRYQIYNDQLELKESETYRFENIFEQYGLYTDNEKKAAILCSRGQSEYFSGNTDAADNLFKQAKDLAPQSSYVFAMSASNQLARNRIGLALKDINEACKRATKKTGSLCYIIKSRVLVIQKDKNGCVEALKKSLEYNPNDVITRHQYGVALSKANKPEQAIREFTKIINEEVKKEIPQETLLITLRTRIINFKRLKKNNKADEDLKLANDLIKQYPHLKDQAWHFHEFEY